MLTSVSLLTHFNSYSEIIVASDASDYGIGAVVCHKFSDGKIRAVTHASNRTLIILERNYNQIEKETLSSIFAVKNILQNDSRKENYLANRSPPIID